jgi:hypothetical protein
MSVRPHLAKSAGVYRRALVFWRIAAVLAVFVTSGCHIVHPSDNPFLRLDKKEGPAAARL